MSQPTLAVLISGGLDSAILLGDALRRQPCVPIYVRCGLRWEAVERSFLDRYLDALRGPALAPLVVLDEPVVDVYGPHWSITGKDVPDAKSADEAVFLPGRNVLLLAKSLLWCHLHGVGAIALGSLQTNPFPDATPAFFRGMQDIVGQAMQGHVEVRLPFGGIKKKAVMQLGVGLPLEHTFSCIAPVNGLHCGQCNKCAERRLAFADAEMEDPTRYAS
ncbi:MAG TPA: 7-cyano-7-deazaguanine synthase [Gemmataceae bacterium]|nr:7-cyano-7-deazaguanine synthase [Gemmataceae bacterium]